MPHVIVKMWPGPAEEQKRRLAERIVKDVMETLKTGEESISVAIEEVKSQDWAERVYKPEVAPNLDRLYKKPGYGLEDL
jgi:4-oxalocrotonate tautomerase